GSRPCAAAVDATPIARTTAAILVQRFLPPSLKLRRTRLRAFMEALRPSTAVRIVGEHAPSDRRGQGRGILRTTHGDLSRRQHGESPMRIGSLVIAVLLTA